MEHSRILRLSFLFLAVLQMLSLTGNMRPVSAEESEPNNGAERMDRIQQAEKNKQAFFGGARFPLEQSDPDLAAIRDRLVYGEIVDRGTLNTRQRALVTLAVLTAGQTLDDMKAHAEASASVPWKSKKPCTSAPPI